MADERYQMDFEQLGIGQVLGRSRLFVPPNQREYSWTDLEALTLYRDFERAVATGASYFLGTIVTIPRDDGMLEVVDGQQRLATTAILLAAIRDHLNRGDNDMVVESINNDFLTGIDRRKRERVPKLRLNFDDNELFRCIVTGAPESAYPAAAKESQKRLRRAYDLARKHVDRIADPGDPWDPGDSLTELVSFIEQRAFVVLLRMSSDADAYRMFETLNDRGLRTSQSDLIKNYLFSRSVDRAQEIRTRWSRMQGSLETLGDDDVTVDFLRDVITVAYGHTRESRIYEAMLTIANRESAALAFAARIDGLASGYVATFNSAHERWNGCPHEVRRAIDALNLLAVRPLRPLLLAVERKFPDPEVAAAFRFAVALGVRLLVTIPTRGGSVEAPLAEAAKGVYKGEVKTTDHLKKKLNGVTPSDEEFRAAFEIARVSKAELARYYLRSLERAVNEEPEPWFMPVEDRSIINLEHVLPRRPEDRWPQFSDDEAAAYVNRLGNQALLRASDNSRAGNAGFAEKRPLFRESPYRLTRLVADAEEWTPAEVVARQKRLAGLALAAWPI